MNSTLLLPSAPPRRNPLRAECMQPPHNPTSFHTLSTYHTTLAPIRRSAGWDHVDHEFHVADKMPDYAHADPCRQEMRSVYIFDLFVSRPSAPDLSTKLGQLDFKATAAPAHLTEVNVGVFFEQASPPPHSPTPPPVKHLCQHTPQPPSSPLTQPPNHTHALAPCRHAHALPSRTCLIPPHHTLDPARVPSSREQVHAVDDKF